MATTTIKLDPAGMSAFLKSGEVASMVAAKAQEVADNARANLDGVGHPEMPVEVEAYTTDRAAAGVLIRHAGGAGVQFKYGVLSNAAGQAGLELRSSSG